VRHVSTCIDLQVIVQGSEVFACLLLVMW
jgi:hypothetical protein